MKPITPQLTVLRYGRRTVRRIPIAPGQEVLHLCCGAPRRSSLHCGNGRDQAVNALSACSGRALSATAWYSTRSRGRSWPLCCAARSGERREQAVAEAMFGSLPARRLLGRGGMRSIAPSTPANAPDRGSQAAAQELSGTRSSGRGFVARPRSRRGSASRTSSRSMTTGTSTAGSSWTCASSRASTWDGVARRRSARAGSRSRDHRTTRGRAGRRPCHHLIHRDVKPANVLVTAGPPEFVYLVDFGIARGVQTDVRVG